MVMLNAFEHRSLAPANCGTVPSRERLLIATSFVFTDSVYPNFKSADRRRFYWQNITTMMASARRFAGEDAQLVVFSTDQPTAEAAPLLARYAVRLESPPFEFCPPDGFYHAFVGALYLLDAILWCARQADLADHFLFLDPDCVVAGDLTPLQDAMSTHGAVAYALPWPLARMANGLTRLQMQEVFAAMAGRPCGEPPTIYGGELLGLNRAALLRMAEDLPDAWQANLQRFTRGEPKLNTEEHILSYVHWRCGVPPFDAAQGLVKRIWTGYRYRNCARDDARLPVWHLPGEKSLGLPRLFDDLVRNAARLDSMTDARARRYLARRLALRGAWLRQVAYGALRLLGRARPGIP